MRNFDPGTRTWRALGGSLLVIAALARTNGAVAAAPKKPKYKFTKIDESGSSFGVPAINAAGTVAYYRLASTGGVELVTVHGATVTAIATAPSAAFGTFQEALQSINASGTVAFAAYPPAVGGVVPNPGVFTGSGGALTTILAPGSSYVAFGNDDDGTPYSIAINDSGTVAFSATTAESNRQGDLYTGDGGGLTLVAPWAGAASINAVGTVAYQEGGPIVGSSYGSIKTSAGATIAAYQFGLRAFWQSTSINASGRVAYRAVKPLGSTDPDGIFIEGGGGPKTTVVVNKPPFDSDAPFGQYLSMNAAGTVVYEAQFDGGVGGIFTGQDVVADKVVAEGDTLFGSKVTLLFYTDAGPQAINDAGQIAFRYQADKNTYGVAVATPTSAPRIFALTSGDVTDSAKPGKDTVTLKGTVPQIGATFDPRTSADTVSFGGAASPVNVAIAAADPGWKGKKGKWTWKSAKGAAPTVTLSVDAVKGTFSVAVAKLDFAAAPPTSFLVSLSTGAVFGSQTAAFVDRGKGGRRFRP